MNPKNKTIVDKTLIEELRGIRDKLSLEMKDMTLEQIKEYLAKKETLHSHEVWKKAS